MPIGVTSSHLIPDSTFDVRWVTRTRHALLLGIASASPPTGKSPSACAARVAA